MGSQKKRCSLPLLRNYILCFLGFLFCSQPLHSQIIINEVGGNGQLELKNIGVVDEDISAYWIYSFPNLVPASSLNVTCDSLVVAPGHIITLDTLPINGQDGEIALFRTNVFNDPGLLAGYVEWGSHGHFNAKLAKEAGIWTNGDFVFPFSEIESIEYDGDGNFSTDWELEIFPSICMENVIDDDDCFVDGGEIFSGNVLNICIDGNPNRINAILTNEVGDSSIWIITDENNNILDNNAQLPFDFDNAGTGVCFLRNVSFTGPLLGNEVGNNLNQLEGCLQISNILQINREIPNGGLVITQDGEVMITGCSDNLTLEMNYLTTTEYLDYWYIVTTSDEVIQFGQNANLNSTLDLSNAQLSQCRIYGVSGEGLSMPIAGTSLTSYLSQSCRDASGNFVIVTKEENESVGGVITSVDQVNFCNADNITPVDVSRDTSVRGETLTWVIVDQSDSIVALPSDPPFALDSFGISHSTIYSLSYQNQISGLELGNFIQDLKGCFDLSNGIDVTIEVPEAGSVSTAQGDDLLTLCSGNVRFEMNATGYAENIPYYYIITTETDTVLEIVEVTQMPFLLDLSGAPEGTCKVYGWSQSGTLNPQAGDHTSQLMSGVCSDLSHDFVTIVRGENPNIGGQIATSSSTTICLDEDPDLISVFINGEVGDSSAWIITDENSNIITADLEPPFDLNGAEIGSCRIYHLSYGSDLTGLAAGNSILDFENCYSLSDPITITRDSLMAGEIRGRDSLNNYTACQGGVFASFFHSDNSQLLEYSYVMVDVSGLIVAELDPNNGPIYDLSFLGPGTYRTFGWAHDGFEQIVIGNPSLSLADGPCQALTSSFVTVEVLPNPHNGGVLSTPNGTTVCIDGQSDLIDLDLLGNEGVVRIAYLITDEDLNIISIPNADPPFEMDDGIPGQVFIWNLAHNGAIQNFEEGANVADIVGCFDLSNPVVIDKVLPDGGMVSAFSGATSLQFCSGTINFDAKYSTTTPGLSYNYVVTDVSGTINQVIDAKTNTNLTINGAVEGTCFVYGWAIDGDPGSVLGMSITELDDFRCSSVSGNFIEIVKVGNANNGGTLTASNLEINCSDGIPDPIEVDLTGAFGSNQSWIITDNEGDIIAIPFAPPFNLDPAGNGVFFIYSVSYEDGLEGLSVFNSIDDLRGCFDLSNGLQVINQQAEGGIISTSDPLNVCAGDDALVRVDVAGAIGQNSQWVLTDLGGEILNLTELGDFDFSSAAPGSCLIWHLSFVDISGLAIGSTIGGLEGCFDLSNSLFVSKSEANAGRISLDNGDLEAVYCAGNVEFNVTADPPDPGFFVRYVLTNSINEVLEVVESPSGTLNLSSAPIGVCRVFVWTALVGSPMPAMGSNVSLLNDGCSDISNNFVTISRIAADGATVASTEGASAFICIDGQADPIRMFNTSVASGLMYTYLTTDLNGNVLDVINGEFVDLDQAGVGVCRVYGYSHDLDNPASVGDNVNTLNVNQCGSVSSNFITITRQAADGGSLLSDVGDVHTICIDNESDQVLFTPNTSATSLAYSFVITDQNNKITSFSDIRLQDFNTETEGECRIYGWSHNQSMTPVLGDDIASLESGSCGDLSSNFIRIIKVTSGSPCIVSTFDLEDYGLQVYPNPTSNWLTIQSNDHFSVSKITVLDLNGRNLLTKNVESASIMRLDLTSFENGTYLLRFESDHAYVYSKFLIIR